MIDNDTALLALRARLKTTVVASTGAITLEALNNGYGRTTGSFVLDGFVAGMELLPDGFSENPPALIEEVTAGNIIVRQARTIESSASGRGLTVGLPSLRKWENKELNNRDPQLWYIQEQYVPGVPDAYGIGPLAPISEFSMYVATLYAPMNTGSQALYKVADAILGVFPPRLALTLADSNELRVRSNQAPYRGQVVENPEKGVSYVVVTIPLWVRTQNTI